MSVHTLQSGDGRRALMRGMMVTAPLLALALVGLTISLRSLLGGQLGALIPLGLLLAFAFALLFQTVATWRDLRAQPTYTRGEVQRRWSKGMVLWFFRSYYLLVEKSVFAVAPETYSHVQEEEVLEIHHWPHTKTVFSAHLLEGRDAEREPDEAPVVPLEIR